MNGHGELFVLEKWMTETKVESSWRRTFLCFLESFPNHGSSCHLPPPLNHQADSTAGRHLPPDSRRDGQLPSSGGSECGQRTSGCYELNCILQNFSCSTPNSIPQKATLLRNRVVADISSDEVLLKYGGPLIQCDWYPYKKKFGHRHIHSEDAVWSQRLGWCFYKSRNAEDCQQTPRR